MSDGLQHYRITLRRQLAAKGYHEFTTVRRNAKWPGQGQLDL